MIAQIFKNWIDTFTEASFVGNELWRWAVLFGLVLASLVAGKILSFALLGHARRLKEADRSPVLSTLVASVAGPITLLLLSWALQFSRAFLVLSESIELFWGQICETLVALAVGWFAFKLVDIIEHFLMQAASKTETTLDDLLVPLIRKTLKIFVVITVVLFIAQSTFDKPIGALLAGLGIGGLAMALAAKDSLSNLFGSATIFLDRPFHLGDRIKVAGHEGVIEEVGFRSTRIRTLMGHQVVIPNATVANEAVENIGRRPYLKRVMNVTVTYDTSPEKLHRGVQIIRELLEARKDNFAEGMPARVYFSDFNDCSLNIVVYYWFTPPDWWEYLEFNHEFNMELLQRFNEEGIEFAFPTQTLYVKRDQ